MRLADHLDCLVETWYLIAFETCAIVSVFDIVVASSTECIAAKSAVRVDSCAYASGSLIVNVEALSADADDSVENQNLHARAESEYADSVDR